MKIQHTKTRSKLSILAVTLLMLAMLVCSFTIMASAATQSIDIDLDDLTVTLETDAAKNYYKTYDGTTDVTVSLKSTNQELGIAAGDDVTVSVTAAFADKNASANNYITVKIALSGADAGKYSLAKDEFTFGAYIKPAKLEWVKNTASVSADFKPDTQVYSADLTLPQVTGLVAGDVIATKNTVTVQTNKAGKQTLTYVVDLNNSNYYADPLTVEFTVNPIVITEVVWSSPEGYEFQLGDPAASEIAVYGKTADGTKYQLNVIYPTGYATANKWYVVEAAPLSENFTIASGAKATATVKIKAVYVIGMNSAVFAGNAGSAQLPNKFMLTVYGKDVPAEVLSKITYWVDGKLFDGTTETGVYAVVAQLPDGYEFVDAQGNKISSRLTATLTVNLDAVHGENVDAPYQIVLTGSNGVSPSIGATVSIPELSKKAVNKFPYYAAYKVAVTNAGNGTYSMLIGINDDLVRSKCDPLTADDLYLYDQVSGTLVKATERNYGVTVQDGYYEVSGLEGDTTYVFVIAPVFHVNFWLTAPGIALIILLIIALLVLLVFIGLAKRKEEKEEETTEETATEAVAPDTVDEEATLSALADEAAEEIAEEVPAEEEETAEDTEGTDEAAAEAMAEVLEEAAAETLETEEETNVPEEMAEQVAEDLADEVEAEDAEAEADADALAAAVAEAMEDTLNESADATDAVEVEEESVETFAAVETDDDNDNDDDDDDDNGFAGFSMAGLSFIDIKAEPEKYQELLAQEQNGEVQLVYRYRRSYLSRMIQSQGNVQDYYTILKNALLSYKGVKARTSWNYEAFNRGRVHVAKLNAKTKTLYLYLALDPEELQDTKYGIIDVSSKKKYASVPVLMKIKGDRKFKYALELIEKLCAEQLQLPALANAEEIDYRAAYQSTEDLVEAGLVKKLVAAIPLNPPTEEPAEEAVAEETAPEAAAEENITFVEPTDAPAVAAAAEEVRNAEDASTEA